MILIILPVKNEENTVLETANRLNKFCSENFKDYEILFLDDHSTDNTLKILKKIKLERLRSLSNRFDLGKGSALKTGSVFSGMIYSLRPDDLICFMDGDGQIRPEEINTFLNLMRLYNADVVIANKRHKYSLTNYSWKRRVVSHTYNFILKVLFGIKDEDTQAGLKIFRKWALDKCIDKISVKGFAFDIDLLVSLRKAGMRIVDAPITVSFQRNAGSVSFKNMYVTFFETIGVWLRLKKGFYAHKN